MLAGMTPDPDAIGLIVRGLEVLFEVRGDAVAFPRCADVLALAEPDGWIQLGALDGRWWFAAPLAEGAVVPAGFSLGSARALFDRVPDAAFALAGRALALVEFVTMHRHCGRCGAPTETVPGERARRPLQRGRRLRRGG